MGFDWSSLFSTTRIMESGSDEASVNSVTLFVALLCACIILGHLLEENKWINESITALLIGLCTGITILLTSRGKSSRILEFNEEFFFIYLLPPIIFNAGFQVKKKQFFRNIMTIMLFGAIGTLISFGIISLGASQLFGRMNVGSLDLRDYLAIGAIFSATDSVCTLQVLNQNDTPLLYSLVFGEGVVNDATSVVLFNSIQKFDLSNIKSGMALKFVGNFFSLFITSTFLGVAVGLCSAYIVKKLYLARHSTDREVALMILMAYLSYVMAEVLGLSGILTVFFCGIVMSHYTWHNVTQSSRVTTKHAFATMSFIAETLIFLYVGMDALDMEKWKFVNDSLGKSVGVSLILLGLVMIGRAAFVFPLSYLSNCTRKSKSEKIELKQQVTIWWAGLMRGAVSMALAYNQFTKSGHTQQPGHAIMITSTISVVLFSTMVFGLMTKPLIMLLKAHESSSSSEQDDMLSSEALSPKSIRLPLLSNGGTEGEETNINNNVNQYGSLSMLLRDSTHQYGSLSMLLRDSTRSVHRYWRQFDDGIMRPVFGGRGFVSHLPSNSFTTLD